MHSVSRFISAVVQDRIVYATLAWSKDDFYYIAISRTKIHFVNTSAEPRTKTYPYKKLVGAIVDVNDETVLKLNFADGFSYVFQTQEREELLQEMALRYTTIQKYNTMLSIDFPLQAGTELLEQKRASFPMVGPRAPEKFEQNPFHLSSSCSFVI